MSEKLERIVGNLPQLNFQSKQRIGMELFSGLGDAERKQLLRGVIDARPIDEQVSALIGSARSLPSGAKLDAIKQAVGELPEAERRQVARSAGPLAPPRDARVLWLIVVIAFATVLVGSFLTIAIGIFVGPQNGGIAKPELALSMFTSVVGFLAGLFVPSPSTESRTE